MENPRCPEHCYSCCLNPIQHPSLDKDIHHVVALLTALCNTCGGVIFLTAPEGISYEEINFRMFKERLHQLFLTLNFPVGLLETCDLVTKDTMYWALIVANSSQKCLPNDSSLYTLKIDMQGRLLSEPTTSKTHRTAVNSEVAVSMPLEPVERVLVDANSNVPAHAHDVNLGSYVSNADTENKSPGLSGICELTWDQNKRDWRNIVTDSEQSIDKCVRSCDTWTPSLPMHITPNRYSLKYIFQSDNECCELIEKVKTTVPGFAIANRSWLSFLPPEADIDEMPTYHLCDILTVAENNDVCLWVVVSDSGEHAILTQLEYMLAVGRSIKHQIVNEIQGLNLTIRCRICSTHINANEFIEKHTGYVLVQNTQEMVYPKFHEKDNFAGLRQGIASLVLWKETPINNCVGHEMSVQLSAEQARTLLRRNKVTYVSAPPGTGKTLCGLSLYREYGGERSVYICPAPSLIQYLRYNGCEGILVQTDEDMSSHIKHGTFSDKKCVVIDESHHLQCSRSSWEKLFMLLRNNRDMFLFVFADNEFQSFNPRNLQVCDYIYELSRKVLGILPRMETFTEMYRNTKKVVSFLQHAVLDTAAYGMNLTCANHMDGDGIHCIVMDNLWSNVRDNSLVEYLNPLLVHTSSSSDAKYQVTDVAVLLDSGYTNYEIGVIREILQTQFWGLTTQSSDIFPREGIVVDRIETFLGLDAGLCIFLLSPARMVAAHEAISNPHYRVFLASRATHKAVFAVSKIDVELVRNMKFDCFDVSIVCEFLTGGIHLEGCYLVWALISIK